jgi:hypothetical protein
MKARTLNCTLKRSPEESNTGSLAWRPPRDRRAGRTAAQNLVAVAKPLHASPLPAPPS